MMDVTGFLTGTQWRLGDADVSEKMNKLNHLKEERVVIKHFTVV